MQSPHVVVSSTVKSDTGEVDAGLVVTLVGCIPSRGAASSVKTAPTKLALTCVAAAMTEACTSLAASTSSTLQVIFACLGRHCHTFAECPYMLCRAAVSMVQAAL